jgi:hypothetical protein
MAWVDVGQEVRRKGPAAVASELFPPRLDTAGAKYEKSVVWNRMFARSSRLQQRVATFRFSGRVSDPSGCSRRGLWWPTRQRRPAGHWRPDGLGRRVGFRRDHHAHHGDWFGRQSRKRRCGRIRGRCWRSRGNRSRGQKWQRRGHGGWRTDGCYRGHRRFGKHCGHGRKDLHRERGLWQWNRRQGHRW